MKKLLLALTLSLFVGLNSIANAQDLQDVVYLKNGSVIRGLIIEQIPNQTIKLETQEGNIFVYKYDEIAKFTKEAPKNSTSIEVAKKASKGRYYGNINFGYGINLHGASDLLDLQIINGYQFNPHIAIGFGTGLKFDGNFGIAIPFFAHVKANFLKSNITPFASLNVGYNVSLSSFFNGFFIEPAIGVGFGVSPKTKLNLTFSYSANNAQYVIYSRYDSISGQEIWGQFKFAFGVTF